MTRRAGRIVRLFLGIVSLAACTASSDTQQVTLLTAQQAAAEVRAERPQLFYIGLALYPEMWSENDVVELAEALQRSSSFDVVPLIASNRATKPRRYPIADDAAIAALVQAAAQRARPGDLVFVHITTHGMRGALARQVGHAAPVALTASQLARQLVPLDGQPSVIILSACYSGSLIPSLQAARRIIITAARADRTSFGCAATSKHTLFGEAELQAFSQSGRSLRQIVEDIRDNVARMEREEDNTPSEPQVSVGQDVAELYEAKLF